MGLGYFSNVTNINFCNLAQRPFSCPSIDRESKQQEQEFQYTTRYLDVKAELLNKNIQAEEIDCLIEALMDGDWNAQIFENDSRFPYVALKAFSDGKIRKEEFVNVMFYWSIRQHHDKSEVQVAQLFDESGHLNESLAKEVLKTFNYVSLDKTHFSSLLSGDPFNLPPHLSEDKQCELLDHLRQLPKSAQTFFIIPDIQSVAENRGLEAIADQIANGEITISQEVQKSPRINIFNRIDIDGQTMRMVPSFEMMQETVKLLGGVNAVKMTPTIGLSSLEDIRQNGLKSERDLGIPFPGLDLPKTADLLKCTELYDFFYHDFYHAIAASKINELDRKRFIKFSDLIHETKLKREHYYQYIPRLRQELRERILDMEHPIYDANTAPISAPAIFPYSKNPEKEFQDLRFMLAIDMAHMNSINRLALQMAKDSKKEESLSNDKPEIMDYVSDLASSRFPRALALNAMASFSELAKDKPSFCEQIVTLGSLAERTLSMISLTTNKPISFLREVNFMIQAKQVCTQQLPQWTLK